MKPITNYLTYKYFSWSKQPLTEKIFKKDLTILVEEVLSHHNKEIIKKIKGMGDRTGDPDWCDGYNWAVNDILSLLEEKGEKM